VLKTQILLAVFLGTLSAHAAPAPGQTPLPTQSTPTTPAAPTTPQPEVPPETMRPDMSAVPENTRPDMSQQGHAQEEWKPSPTPGEPIFDWSKHKDEREVHHPFAEKGLVRIGKDDTYYYKVDESQQHSAIAFSVGTFPLDDLKNPAGGQFASFYKNYQGASSSPAFMIDKEWTLWRGLLGKLDLQMGTGGFFAEGHGHFVSSINADKTPLENFTFIAIPNHAGVVYRMQFKHRQLFVPYGLGGAMAIAMAETRDDNQGPKFGGALAVYGGGGVAINMNYYNYLSRVQLDREYGINGIYLTLEYRQLFGLTTYDFTTEYINGGFLFEY
jgi:hypothetical protein